MNNFVGNILQN